jgi:hypothetical protein
MHALRRRLKVSHPCLLQRMRCSRLPLQVMIVSIMVVM